MATCGTRLISIRVQTRCVLVSATMASSSVAAVRPPLHLICATLLTGQQTSIKRIHKEIADVKRENLGDIKLAPSEQNMHVWRGSLPGPEGSVYEGGVFHVEMVLGSDYPYVIIVRVGNGTDSRPQILGSQSCFQDKVSRAMLSTHETTNDGPGYII